MFLPVGDDIEREIAPIPFSTLVFFAACLSVFAYQYSLPPELYNQLFYTFGMIPAVLLSGFKLPAEAALIPGELTLVTSMFLHGDIMHFAGNMLYLWVFGFSVEEATGHIRFALFYLLCGLAAGLGQALVDPNSMIPGVGASGAISGVLGAYILVYPYQRIRVLYFLGFRGGFMHVPALIVIGIWIGLQIWSMVAVDPTAEGGGTAWTAHVAGFAAGIFLILFFRRKGVKLFDTHVPV